MIKIVFMTIGTATISTHALKKSISFLGWSFAAAPYENKMSHSTGRKNEIHYWKTVKLGLLEKCSHTALLLCPWVGVWKGEPILLCHLLLNYKEGPQSFPDGLSAVLITETAAS